MSLLAQVVRYHVQPGTHHKDVCTCNDQLRRRAAYLRDRLRTMGVRFISIDAQRVNIEITLNFCDQSILHRVNFSYVQYFRCATGISFVHTVLYSPLDSRPKYACNQNKLVVKFYKVSLIRYRYTDMHIINLSTITTTTKQWC